MTNTDDVQKKWWVYLDNKKASEPVTLEAVKKFCGQFHDFHFELFENLLIRGVCIRFPDGKIRLKKASQKDLIQKSSGEAL